MKRVTRNISLEDARDLLEHPPRACIGLKTDNGPLAQPVVLFWDQQRYYIRIPTNATAHPVPGQEIVLLVDEGTQYFDLRAIYVRGQAQPAEPPPGAPAVHVWFELVPAKTVVWDYGKFREVRDDAE